MAAFAGWERVPVATPGGVVAAPAPLILSASRSTDIPAFFGEWFLARLRAGYAIRENPFDRSRRIVALARARAVVFWTKDAGPFLPLLAEVERRGLAFYFLFTLNDYEAEGLEPGVPPLAARIAAFRELSRRLGPERVVWRYDPLILGGRLDEEELLGRVRRVGDALAGATRRLIVSFADIASYRKVRLRLDRVGFPWREFTAGEAAAMAAALGGLARGWGIEAMACAEPWDLAGRGVAKGRCIDGALLARIALADPELRRFLAPALQTGEWGLLADRGQRRACGCLASQDLGRYGTCRHGCRYCYALPADPQAPPLEML